MLLHQWGALLLDTPVIKVFGPAFAAVDGRKAMITPRHLLLHEAGFPPDPTPTSYCAPNFACPETARQPSDRRLTFSCQPKAFEHLVHSQRLDREPGLRFVYSDLSMITLMNVVGSLAERGGHVTKNELLPACLHHDEGTHEGSIVEGDTRDGNVGSGNGGIAATSIAQCYYEAFARKFIFDKLRNTAGASPSGAGLSSFFGFRLPRALAPCAAPTWNDTVDGFPGECIVPYRRRVLQGEVSDGNAFALGGVAGHAGLFASAPLIHALVVQAGLLFAPPSGQPLGGLGISPATVKLFTTVHDARRSSRALGWDTLAPPFGGSLCGNMSELTFTHTGYTGTLVCADPQTRGGLLTVLLTNRVYPKADDVSERAIHKARVLFNSAVLASLAVSNR